MACMGSWLLSHEVVGGDELADREDVPRVAFLQHSFMWEPPRNWHSRHSFFVVFDTPLHFVHCLHNWNTSSPWHSASWIQMDLFGYCLPIVGLLPPPSYWNISWHWVYLMAPLSCLKRRQHRLWKPWWFSLFISGFHWWWPFKYWYEIAWTECKVRLYFWAAIHPWLHQFLTGSRGIATW